LLPEAREICPTTTRHLVDEGALLVDVREPSEIAALAFDVSEIIRIPLGDLRGASLNSHETANSLWSARAADAT
jgi:rhodanese-related sulfurtransferase